MILIISIDNEFKNLIPQLALEEYAQLEQNLLESDIREPISLWQGIIIDGHNRYEIAQKHNLTYETKICPKTVLDGLQIVV